MGFKKMQPRQRNAYLSDPVNQYLVQHYGRGRFFYFALSAFFSSLVFLDLD